MALALDKDQKLRIFSVLKNKDINDGKTGQFTKKTINTK